MCGRSEPLFQFRLAVFRVFPSARFDDRLAVRALARNDPPRDRVLRPGAAVKRLERIKAKIGMMRHLARLFCALVLGAAITSAAQAQVKSNVLVRRLVLLVAFLLFPTAAWAV